MKKPGAILAALFVVINMCFPVLNVFAQDAVTDTFNEPETATATAGVTLSASFDGSRNEDCVSDFDELREWLEDNNTSGKEISFSDSITISAGEYVYIYGVTLNTMNHSLIIEGEVRPYGAKMIGDGANNKPVVTVSSGGTLFIGGQSEITAVAESGTAIRIESGGTFNVGESGWCDIYSEGEGSVGVYAEDGLELSYTSIRSGGAGVIAGGDVGLFMCDIAAAVPVEVSGNVFLDTCIMSESVPDATVISSKITGIDEQDKKDLYRMSALGKDIGWYDREYYLNTLLDDRTQLIPVSWDTSGIDINTVGEYEINGTIPSPYDRFELDSEFPIRAAVEIIDASLPVFCEILAGRSSYNIKFLYSAADLSGLTLWRSDEEENWYDYTQDAEMNYDGETLWLTLYGMPDHPIFLVFEVDGLGETQIFNIKWNDDGLHVERGGDRYGDRGETTLPPAPGNPSDGTPPTDPPDETPTTSQPDETPTTTPQNGVTRSVLVETTVRRAKTERGKSYEPAETAYNSIPPIQESTETIYDAAPSAPANEPAQSQLPQSSDKTGEAEPSEQDMVAPNTVAEKEAAVQAIAAAQIEGFSDNTERTENAQSRRPYSDSVIPIVCVSSVGLLGAGAYLGFAGKVSLKSLIKLLAGRFGI